MAIDKIEEQMKALKERTLHSFLVAETLTEFANKRFLLSSIVADIVRTIYKIEEQGENE